MVVVVIEEVVVRLSVGVKWLVGFMDGFIDKGK